MSYIYVCHNSIISGKNQLCEVMNVISVKFWCKMLCSFIFNVCITTFLTVFCSIRQAHKATSIRSKLYNYYFSLHDLISI